MAFDDRVETLVCCVGVHICCTKMLHHSEAEVSFTFLSCESSLDPQISFLKC